MLDFSFRQVLGLRGLLVCAGLAMTGCGPGTPSDPGTAGNGTEPGLTPIPVKVLRQSTQCGLADAGVELISDAEAWTRWWHRQSSPLDPAADSAPVLDFTEITVVVIAMGQQRTAGYAIEVGDHAGIDASGIVTIPVQWIVPAADAMTAQVLTSPCVALRVDAVGFTGARLASPAAVLLQR
jgi:hypothetical protein